MKKREPILGLVELAKMFNVPKKRITYLATYNPLPEVVLVSGFDRKTYFYRRQELLDWYAECKLKREPRS